jgi:hypothetical protein
VLGRDICSREDITLFICGEWRYAKTDVCVMDRNGYLLLVQEANRQLEIVDPEPQSPRSSPLFSPTTEAEIFSEWIPSTSK